MNRRDFLKTLGLVLSALVLPKAKAESGGVVTAKHFLPVGDHGPESEHIQIAADSSLKTHRLMDCVPVTDEWLADARPGTRLLLDSDGFPQTLMGYPIYVFDDMQAMARDAAQVADEQGLVAPWDV